MPRIMIADDAEFMRMMIRENLERAGFSDIVEAVNGEEAASLFLEAQPDLVLLDISMPVKSGLEALRDIREACQDARVVMCSAHGQESMIIEALKLGALDFIVKPFKPARLTKVVQNILGGI